MTLFMMIFVILTFFVFYIIMTFNFGLIFNIEINEKKNGFKCVMYPDSLGDVDGSTWVPASS